MSLRSPASAPAVLGEAALANLTRAYASRVHAGEFAVEVDPRQRWHIRLHADDEVDVWLISWTTDQGTELHDHGESAGAFTVVGGALSEAVWTGAGPADMGDLADLRRPPGQTVTFGAGYVHDVRNLEQHVAVSVHAYSPPLALMHYYNIESGRLHRRASQWTDDPEAPSPERAA